MRPTLAWLISAILASALVAAAEKKIQLKDLPVAVREAVQRETKDATLKGLVKETEAGQTFYEAETEVNGRARDLLFDATGHLVEVEETIAIDAAPAAVKMALEKRGRIVRLETATRGSVVTYEGVVEKNGKKTEVAVDASGKPVGK